MRSGSEALGLVGLLFALAFLGGIAGYTFANKQWQDYAVKKGVAEYRVSDTGTASWHWKEPPTN